MKANGDGYIFSLDGEETPVTGKHVYNGFVKALKKIGIGKAEREERGLTFHAWLFIVAKATSFWEYGNAERRVDHRAGTGDYGPYHEAINRPLYPFQSP